MNKLRTTWAAVALAAASVACIQAALAQKIEPPRDMTLEDLVKKVREALPPILLDRDPSIVVKAILQAKLDPDSLLKKFNPGLVSTAVFGRGGGDPDAFCAQPLTAALDRDEGECTLTQGDTSAGNPTKQGPFAMLAYSKNMALGNITILKRPAFVEIKEDRPSVRLTDDAAYEKAKKFAVETLGLSPAEFPPLPPKGVSLPVNILSLGFNSEGVTGAPGTGKQIDFMKVVHFPRALVLPEPLVDPISKQSLTHVLAPGQAVFFVNDSPGVQGARVENWVSMPIDTRLDLSLVKSADNLAREIAEDLYAQGGKRVATLQMGFALGPSSNPNPDDPNSPNCPACGAVLRPVLRVALYTFDASDPPQGYLASPGLVQDYQLVQGAAERPTRLLR